MKKTAVFLVALGVVTCSFATSIFGYSIKLYNKTMYKIGVTVLLQSSAGANCYKQYYVLGANEEVEENLGACCVTEVEAVILDGHYTGKKGVLTKSSYLGCRTHSFRVSMDNGILVIERLLTMVPKL